MIEIRVVLPYHLRTIARVQEEEVRLSVEEPVTLGAALDQLESAYPTLKGTIRAHDTHQRRPFIRFFACQEDLSHERQDTPLPESVIAGREPLLIVGAMAGG